MSTKTAYINFCKKNEVPLFFKPFWLDTYETKWDVTEAKENGATAYFVYSVEKKFNFSIVRNNFLTPYAGVIFAESNTKIETKQKLISTIIKQLPSFDEFHIDLHYDIPVELNFSDFKQEEKITNILLLDDMASVTAHYKSALKRQINKAKKNLTIEETDDIKLFYSLHEKTFSKQNKKAIIPFSAFQKIWKTCKSHHCGQLFFAKDSQGNTHAAIFLAYDYNTAYYLAGGTDAAFYGSGAMSYLMHSCVEKSFLLNKKYFDFEGSMIPNVNRFFKNFSPQEKRYISLTKFGSLLLKMYKRIKKN